MMQGIVVTGCVFILIAALLMSAQISGMRWWECVLGAAAITAVMGLALGSRAGAHEHWINYGGYVDPTNPQVHCCGKNDCPVVPDSDVEASPAGWRIKSTGEVVPFSQTYTSEDGKFYRCHRFDGSRRCFFAPGQGS